MGIAELTQGRRWKNFMKYLYGIGAAVVIIGALFKITHWPGATIMLTAGLTTEAIIFFFSAFEPLHEELDWTLVYPELAGLESRLDLDIDKSRTLTSASGGGSVAGTESLEKFNKMIEDAGDANLFEKFGTGIQNLNEKVSQMSDISDATVATNEYSQNMKSAASIVDTFTDNYKQASEAVNYSAESLSDSFTKTSQNVSASGEEFASAYKRLTDSMEVDFSALKDGNSEYNEHIGSLNKNLTALNAIFELQLNEADLDKMMIDLQGAVENSKKYNQEIIKLGDRLEALNNIYGNMLTAMNVNI